MVTVEEVRAIASRLPRSYEVYVRKQIKFRVGKIVYVAFSRDQTVMGFAFPKEWRSVIVDAEPDKFMLPSLSDMRFNWVLARMAALDYDEMRDLVLDAWRMVVPKRVAAEYEALERYTEGSA
jgi:hypothetical protein